MSTETMNRLWNRKNIAEFFAVSLKTADVRYIADPSFPKPITLPRTHKRWLPKDIERWAETQKG